MQKLFLYHIKLFSIMLVLSVFSYATFAQTERVINYQYDAAGNIIRVFTQSQSLPPTIDQLMPNFINRGRAVSFTLTGDNLLAIDISTDAPGLTISDINASLNLVTFRLIADNDAPIGNAILRFTTALGTVEQTIFVAEASPDLTTQPNPIAVAQSTTPTNIKLLFSESRPENETYTVTIADTSIATSLATFTILAGQSEFDLPLTGIADGVTNLSIELPAKFYTYAFPVFVGKSFQELLEENPDMRQRNLFSNIVGIYVQPNNTIAPNTVVSSVVGINYQNIINPVLSRPVSVVYTDILNPVLSRPVGVLYQDINNPILSLPVGINVGGFTSYAYSSPVETIYGALITDLQNISAAVDTTVTIDVQGFNLNEVTTVSVSPDTDITVDAFIANTEATTLTITLTIGIDAALGQREILIEDSNGAVINETSTPLTFEIQ